MQQHWRKSTSRTLRRVETHVINKHTASVLRCRGQTSWRSEEENGRHKGRQHRKGNNLIQPSTKLMAKHKKIYKTISTEMSRILTHTQIRVGNIHQIHLTTMSSHTFKLSFVFALRAERNIWIKIESVFFTVSETWASFIGAKILYSWTQIKDLCVTCDEYFIDSISCSFFLVDLIVLLIVILYIWIASLWRVLVFVVLQNVFVFFLLRLMNWWMFYSTFSVWFLLLFYGECVLWNVWCLYLPVVTLSCLSSYGCHPSVKLR